MDLKVTPDVLIPRPETETLVEAALSVAQAKPSQAPLRILDLGTGSGAIVLAMASERPGQDFYAVDQSEKALAVAQENACAYQLDKAITFLHGNWFDPVRDRGRFFDVIVSNPPYISLQEFEALPAEITQYEPREALDGGSDGLKAIRRIIEQAVDHLVPGGWLLFEIGHNQWAAVHEMVSGLKTYGDCTMIKDYSGCDRVVRARAR
jgi:release factor glutamine methyltransferase